MADGDDGPSIAALGSRPPGEFDDPYSDVEVEALPGWWREAIRSFDAHGLRPYRPPRFVDGTLTPPVVEQLETDLGVSIVFAGEDVRYGDDWSIQVDGESIGDVGRHRDPGGYTVYELTSDAFVARVRSAVGTA